MGCVYFLIIGLIMCVNFGLFFGYNTTQVTEIHKKIMANYVDTVIPSHIYRSKPLMINISFNLLSLKEYDAVASKLSITGYFEIKWIDDRIVWDPTKYGNVYSILLRQKDVWIPNILSYHDYSDVKYIGNPELLLRYLFNGQAYWYPTNVFDFTCNADVTYFPFDTQNCTVLFLPLGYTHTELQFTVSEEIGQEYFAPQAIWDIISATTEVDRDKYNTYIYMHYIFKRRPSFFIVNILLPIVTLCIMNLLVFFLPAEEGERVGFSITVLLAIAVYLTIVSDALPEVSNPSVAILCYMLFFHLVISVCIMVCTILGLRFYFRNNTKNDKVPGWLVKTTKNLGQCCCSGKKTDNKYSTDMKQENPVMNGEKVHNEDDWQCLNSVSWRDVGLIFDKLCFTIFFIFIVLGDSLFLITVVFKL